MVTLCDVNCAARGKNSSMEEIVAVTRGLTAQETEAAYRSGIFPMGRAGANLITWHQPDPRAIMPLDKFHVPKRLARTLRHGGFTVSADRDFPGVMRACAADRPVWITPRLIDVYSELHAAGKAHSVEVWKDGALVGGLYGIHIGGVFCGESMFARETDASKVALVHLVERLRERQFEMLEVQYVTDHLAKFGAVAIPLKEYLKRLKAAQSKDCRFA